MSSRSTKSRSTTTKKWHFRLVGREREREKFQEIKNDKGMIGGVRERNKKVVD